jgi:hypothetical protein
MAKATKQYATKSSALRAMKKKANYIHGNGQSGDINFGRIYVNGSYLIAESTFWEETSLQDFLDGKRELIQ